MNTDHFYAEMLDMMRSQGRKDNPTTIQVGIMQSPTSVKIGDLVLTEEDLYIADYLMEGYKREVKIPYVSSVSGNSNSVSVKTQSEICYTDGLKKGDLVAVQKLENNMYLILVRMVRAS